MFTGFNLTIDNSFFDRMPKSFNDYKIIGENHLSENKAHCEKQLEEYIVKENTIDGTALQNDWFPQIKTDIFISHSHIDEDLASALAGWINDTFNINCFIDSAVWGYSGKLLEKLNDIYSNKRKDSHSSYGVVYDHESCNKVSQHVNMMLCVALQRMIDKSEAIFLLNTHNSVDIFDNLNKCVNRTYSPWIYSEILCSEIVRKKSLLEYRDNVIQTIEFAQESVQNRAFQATYEISLEHLNYITSDILLNWDNTYKRIKYKYPLDILYKWLNIKEVANLNFENNRKILIENGENYIYGR
ncbi:MAG: hypothetical protein K0Q87_399 [Neobacillus sp.]|jgi:hypothetical protein|nr:hypothetical protein [Neobacillus sp.]